MKNWLISLTPVVLGIAGFVLVYNGINGWGYFLFGAVVIAIAITNKDVDCDCEGKCGDKCKCN
jgi:hypothetical protein